jgi:hypothetical protein
LGNLVGFPLGSSTTDSILRAVYHIINRDTARQPTFVQEQGYEAFLKTLAEAHVQCFGSRNEIFKSTLLAVLNPSRRCDQSSLSLTDCSTVFDSSSFP